MPLSFTAVDDSISLPTISTTTYATLLSSIDNTLTYSVPFDKVGEFANYVVEIPARSELDKQAGKKWIVTTKDAQSYRAILQAGIVNTIHEMWRNFWEVISVRGYFTQSLSRLIILECGSFRYCYHGRSLYLDALDIPVLVPANEAIGFEFLAGVHNAVLFHLRLSIRCNHHLSAWCPSQYASPLRRLAILGHNDRF